MAWYDKMRNAGIVGVCLGFGTLAGSLNYHLKGVNAIPEDRNIARVVEYNEYLGRKQLDLPVGVTVRDLADPWIGKRVMEDVRRKFDARASLLSDDAIRTRVEEWYSGQERRQYLSSLVALSGIGLASTSFLVYRRGDKRRKRQLRQRDISCGGTA